MNKFDAFSIGDTAEITHKITLQDVEKFVDLTGDDNKIHTDKEFAAETSFKKPVAHGMLGASFISTIIGTKIPGDGALWISQNLEFLLPVRVGDTITIKAVILKKNDKEKILDLKTDIVNEYQQLVLSGNARVKIIEQAIPAHTNNINSDSFPKVALVIGASGGIGKETAIQLAKDGFDIALHFFSNSVEADNIKNAIISLGRKAKTYQADITDEQQIHVIIEKITRDFKSISLLVNCAISNIHYVRFSELKWEMLQEQIDINLKSTFNLVKAILPILEQHKNSKIILISTLYTEGTPPVELIGYISAKSALNGFFKSLAVELAPKSILVNMVSPGMTETDLLMNIPEKIKFLTAAKTPLRRLASPLDIAGAISFLASEKANYITGETIRVNGGQIMI